MLYSIAAGDNHICEASLKITLGVGTQLLDGLLLKITCSLRRSSRRATTLCAHSSCRVRCVECAMPHSSDTARGLNGYGPLPDTVATSSPLLLAVALLPGICAGGCGAVEGASPLSEGGETASLTSRGTTPANAAASWRVGLILHILYMACRASSCTSVE